MKGRSIHTIAWSIVVGLLFGACSKTPATQPSTLCDAGVNVYCPCADLSMGTMQCASDGQSFLPCTSADSGEVCNMPNFAGSGGSGGSGGDGVGGFGGSVSSAGGGGSRSNASTVSSSVGGSGGANASSSASSSGSGGTLDTECPGKAISLSATTDATVLGDTTTSVDEHFGQCGGENTPEIVYAVTPQGNGTLVATLSGIDGTDPILYAALGSCDGGTPLGCADATGAGGTETLSLEAVEGKTIWVYADANTPGSFSLTFHLATGIPGEACPGAPIMISPGQDITTAGDTSIADSHYKGTGACAVSMSTKEIVYSVTPIAAGTLSVTMDPTYDGDLYARIGTCTTSTQQVGCSESGGVGVEEKMSFVVTQGTKVSVFVDGANGSSGAYSITFHLQ